MQYHLMQVLFFQDCNGHGTHVAGTAAGATYGVARGATVHSVRVLGCRGSGTFAGVISGMYNVAHLISRDVDLEVAYSYIFYCL